MLASGAAAGGTVATSAWNVKFWYDYDGLQWPLTNGLPTAMAVKKGRFTKAYAVAGDTTVALPLKDSLMQFSIVLAAGDTWSKVLVRLNGTTIREVTPDRMNQLLLDHGMNVLATVQLLLDHGMNVLATVPNRCDVVVGEVNNDLNAILPISGTDTFEVIITVATCQGAAQMVILTEYHGLPTCFRAAHRTTRGAAFPDRPARFSKREN